MREFAAVSALAVLARYSFERGRAATANRIQAACDWDDAIQNWRIMAVKRFHWPELMADDYLIYKRAIQ